MKKIIVGSVLVIAIFTYAYFSKEGSQAALPNNISSSNSSSNSKQTSNSEATSTSIASTGLKDGTYTGNQADAFYGTVQVQTTINSGKITEVKFLQYPNDQGHSTEISNVSMPILTQEVMQAQNANVDVVTGATQTSQAFVQSLQSALDKAKS